MSWFPLSRFNLLLSHKAVMLNLPSFLKCQTKVSMPFAPLERQSGWPLHRSKDREQRRAFQVPGDISVGGRREEGEENSQ